MTSIIKVDTIQDQDGNNIINENANTITIGASGDTITIPAGATFDASASTTTLPDDSVTTAKIVDANVTLAKLSATGTKDATTFLRGDNTFAEAGGGIEEADMFRLTASHTGDGDITSNLERVDSSGFSKIGTGMTESSGIFTFPSTGIYQILVQANISYNNQSDNSATVSTSITLNNSSYTNVAYALSGNGNQTGATGVTCYSQYFLDVTDISNVKVKFTTGSFQGTLEGDTDINRTCFSFIRLGDT
jgi:hypothetical protein